MQPLPNKNNSRTKPRRGETHQKRVHKTRLPQIVRFDDVIRVNATALQRIGCRAVVPRQPHIIYSRIANADIHGFRIANSEEQGPHRITVITVKNIAMLFFFNQLFYIKLALFIYLIILINLFHLVY